MSDVAIRVEGLSKRYRLGAHAAPDSLREALNDVLSLAALRRGRRDRAKDREFWAVDRVSFEVKRGEVLGLIGRNGAGKSTLFKMLARITEPTAGRAEIYGKVGSLLEVGTGFQPELTGRENIYLNGAILGMRRAEITRKFDEIVSFAEVDRFIETPVKRYSSGMYVRLAFAVAAHLDPDVLLVDEVLAVGDARFQKKCLGKIGDVARTEGRTVIFVSHSMGAISSLCPRSIYLEDGRIRGIGPTPEIVAEYTSDAMGTPSDDLDRFRTPGLGEEVGFRDIRLLSRDGTHVRFGDPLRFAVTLEASRDLSGLSLSAGLFTGTGQCIGAAFDTRTFDARAGEHLALQIAIRSVTLAPGYYHAGFGVGRGGRESIRQEFDVVIGRPAFQVLPVPQNGHQLAEWDPNWGNLVLTDTEVTMASERVA